MTVAAPRGRAASAIRPGVITKRVLLGELPLETGEFVSEAAIVDLFGAYRRQLYEYNQTHERSHHIKGMHHRSFYTMFRFARLLGLVEFVREEEADWKRKAAVTPATSLMRLEQTEGELTQRISNRRVFRLTDVGKEDVKAWLDLTNAWKEQWPVPQYAEIPVIVEEVEEAAPEVKERKPREAVEKVTVPTLKLQVKPTKGQYLLLLKHLRKLNEIGIDSKKVQKEVDKLANAVGEWVAEAIESLQNASDLGDAGKAVAYRHLRNVLTDVDEGLLDRDIPRAIEHLEKLV